MSQLTGISQQEIIDRALLLYLDSMSKYLDLRQEMKEWDQLSDEAWEHFERSRKQFDYEKFSDLYLAQVNSFKPLAPQLKKAIRVLETAMSTQQHSAGKNKKETS